jgi:Flp pilus assembly protein CpaB
MRSRGLVVAIAVVLAVAAAAAVILYTQGVKEDARVGGDLVTVIVAQQRIEANQSLQPLIDAGVFKEIEIPQDALVADAVTSTRELEDVSTVTPILANEQISRSRLSSSETPLNEVGVSEGHIGVTFEYEAPQGGNGNIQPGDNVAVFATFNDTQVLVGPTTQQLANGNVPDGLQQKKLDAPDFTVTLIRSVRVLRIENPEVDTETGQQSNSDRIRVTLDLVPEDASNLVFAQENGRVWLGLLNPKDAEGFDTDASTVPLELLLGAKLG